MFKRPLLVFLVAVAFVPSARAAFMTNGGFESGSPLLGPRPTTFGQWRGDRVGYVSGQNGITPFEGKRMLQFVNGEFVPSSSSGSQYWQNVDLGAFAAEIDAGLVSVSGSAVFNRVPGNAFTDTEFNLVVRARSSTPTTFNDLAEASARVYSDGDGATWELASISFVLPTGTRFLQVEINAVKNVRNNTTNPEFDGHYADDVKLDVTVVPAPAAWLMAVLGIAPLSAWGLWRRLKGTDTLAFA